MRYLIWDFDGTLGYREGGWSGSILEVLEAHGMRRSLTADDIRPHIRTGFRWHDPSKVYPASLMADAWWEELVSVFMRAFVALCGVAPGTAERLAREVRQQYLRTDAWRLFDDSAEALRELHDAGYRHLLLSNHVPELPAILDHLQIAGQFERVFNSADVGVEKPNPQAYANVLAHIGQNGQVWMIGDNPTADVAGARAAGLQAILVRRVTPGIEPFFPGLRGLTEYLLERC
jgi:HAD superfamily hydrolase (TIGR01549 family)